MAFPGSGGPPKCVRNFFLEIEVDGVKRVVRTGPTGSKGGFFLKVLIRQDGKVSDSYMTVQGSSDGLENELNVQLHDHVNGLKELEFKTLSNVILKPKVSKRKKKEEKPVKEKKALIQKKEAFWRIEDE